MITRGNVQLWEAPGNWWHVVVTTKGGGVLKLMNRVPGKEEAIKGFAKELAAWSEELKEAAAALADS